MKIILLDNYDSFTYNLMHYLGELGAEVETLRNDAVTVEELLARKPSAIVISPGPGTPQQSGICLELIKTSSGKVPIFGVCLGMQAIGEAFGGKVIRAPRPMHGKISPILHKNQSVFAGLPNPFNATRYHSLIVEKESLPDCLEVTAIAEEYSLYSSEKGIFQGRQGEVYETVHETKPDAGKNLNQTSIIMGLQHKIHNTHGVQFHPESIASEHGHALIKNFLDGI